ncbi:hypothetical protein U2084_14975, partial [Listeria monocytogenes]|uniref:hypothetical protein n=1 Tax=Listeria monocytogenes TaxID=1639 RepID=UPI002FDC37F7
MTTRKFYKTIIQLEVLSEEPIPDEMDVAQIAFEATEGDYSMVDGERIQTILNGQQTADALKEQASDPSFFLLTEDGND